MTAQEFVYWLQGSMELGNQITFDQNQVQIIKDHLSLVLKKETPTRSFPMTNIPNIGSPLITQATC